MHCCISAGERRVGISSLGDWEVMKAKGSVRRLTHRSVLPTVLVAGILLPFLFIRAAFLALDAGASLCPSISCLGWRLGPRFLWGSDASLELGKELRSALVDAERGGVIDPKIVEAAPESWNDLIQEMMTPASYQHLDIKNFALKTRAMLVKMEHKVQSARLQTSIYGHLASNGIPKSMHCLTLMLMEEYTVNALARSSLPPPEIAYRLTNMSYLHLALLTDNVLAAAVVVSSAVGSSANPEKIVFHIITDKKTYTAMHTWFAIHPGLPATVEVKGLHQFDWPSHVSATIMETVDELHRGSVSHHYHYGANIDNRRLQALKPSSFSLLNHLRIHLPDLFPKLEKVILLDDDVIVQQDLSPLWNLDLNGNVNGAVIEGDDNEGHNSHCIGKELDNILNFSNPLISALEMRSDQCSWLDGMNVFDLQSWRRSNITKRYQQWLKLNRESGFLLFGMGSLPLALIAFDGQVQPIDPSWHLSSLGWRMPGVKQLESAAVLHFSGPRKPWLEIGLAELRRIWRAHLDFSDDFIRSCRVTV